MGLFEGFSDIRRQSSTALGPAEAFAAIALVSVAVDGYVADAEVKSLISVISRMQLF
jgi:hypothetical protein